MYFVLFVMVFNLHLYVKKRGSERSRISQMVNERVGVLTILSDEKFFYFIILFTYLFI